MIGSVRGKLQVEWTDETVELLKRLWDEGLSAEKISWQIPGSTRNGCLGKVHRLGLASHKKQPSGLPKIRKERVVKATFTVPTVITLPVVVRNPPKGDLIPFIKANYKTCRSVEGYGEDENGRVLAMFCPGEKTIEASFCPYHQRIYYRRDAR